MQSSQRVGGTHILHSKSQLFVVLCGKPSIFRSYYWFEQCFIAIQGMYEIRLLGSLDPMGARIGERFHFPDVDIRSHSSRD